MADENMNTIHITEKQKVQEITDKLEEGLKELFESEKYKTYLSTMSKFHNYSFNNTLLIAMQKPEATLVAGYKAWQKNFERHVNKGEKAIRILLIQNEALTEFSLVNVRGMDTQELVAALTNMSGDDKLSIQAYLESKGAWTTELGNEKSREFEEYHLDVRYNLDTDEITDVKAKMTEQIDSNLFVMGQAEQLVNQLEAEKTIFTSDERNLIVNYAYKLDDMDKTISACASMIVRPTSCCAYSS